MTDTGYTSWTTDISVAEELARFASRESNLSGEIAIFRVKIRSIEEDRIFEGEAREDEYLIEGAVEGVQRFEGDDDENDA